jgi:serine/threonine-protein kinase
MDTVERLTAALAGRYSIERELGAGGMATVYLAEDLKHKRKVALKVLKPELAAVLGADRFVQEITTTAALQHPHILPLFDSGTADSFLYYVMPFIDGETLRDKLNRETQLGVDDAVRIAREVLDALDYAHQHGIVHRDVKPENILLHGGHAMVADFGIALAVSAAAGGRMTETGLSLGTPHYMSPEQATAEKEITARSDVYSLGSVLYEMLGGEPPHMGNSAQQIIMKIIAEPVKPVTALRKSVPPNVAGAISKSLEKLPADRFESAKAFGEALGNPAYTNASSAAAAGYATAAHRGVPVRTLVITVALAVVVTAIVAAFAASRIVARRDIAGSQPPSRLVLPTISASMATEIREIGLSPAGDVLLYNYRLPDARQLFAMQALDAVAPTPFPNLPTDFGNPEFSPDGKWFVGSVPGDRHLYRQSIAGGTAESLPFAAVTHTVDGRGTIWWQSDANDLHYLDAKNADVPVKGLRPNLMLMQILPGERYALMERRPAQGTRSGPILVVNLKTGEEKTVIAAQTVEAFYTSGLLVYCRLDGSIDAVPFDLASREVTGSPVTIAADVASGSGFAEFVVSRNGTLAYRPRGPRNLVLVARDGVVRATIAGVAPYHGPKFSPDGRRLAFDLINGDGRDVWIYEIGGGATTRATFVGDGHDVVWSPDGRSIAFLSGKSGSLGIYRKRADGSTESDSLFASAQLSYSGTWIADGGAILTVAANLTPKSGSDIALVKNGGRGPLEPVLATPYEDMFPMLSPDGRWLAFVSDQSGRPEVYLRPFGREGDQVQVSVNGGSEPVWSKDGRELFFRATEKGGATLVSAAVQTTPSLAISARTTLFSLADMDATSPHPNYDVSPDGKTFVMARRNAATANIVIIQNLPALVKKLQGATAMNR